MDVKKAVSLAKNYLEDLFADEKIYNIGLEEVSFNDQTKTWSVTVGFSRPWDEPPNSLVSIARHIAYPARSYKVVEIVDAGSTGEVTAVKNREIKS
ncbi:MAG: hypothetical protein P4L55_13330 [Syntrophobacteraceae bacterium]|nr:hypothetical protein [Syntrophobacteraceae bacterium]